MASKKKKRTRVSEEELKTVEGLVGAKSGLALAAKMDLLNAKTIAIPLIIGSTAAMFLPGKETEDKVKGAIKFVKESQMDKATYVFQKISKCKAPSKKPKMQKKAGAKALGYGALFGFGMLPKPGNRAIEFVNKKGDLGKLKQLVNLPKK